MAESESSIRRTRWDRLLPMVALVVALLLLGLASLARFAFEERASLALDGRILGLAHDVEQTLRDHGEPEGLSQLSALLDAAGPDVRGLGVRGPDGRSVGEVGETSDALPTREVEIFVGPQGRAGHGGPGPWGPGGPGGARGGRGRRTVVLRLGLDAGDAPLSIRLLPFAAGLVGFGLVGLAAMGGRLLVRQEQEAAAEARRRRADALGSAGAGLAHQLRNPLATIKGSCQLLQERLDDPALAKRALVVIHQAARMDRMLATLLDFARPPKPEPQVFALAEPFEVIRERHPDVEILDGADVRVHADPDHVLHVLENLVANALQTKGEGGPVELSAHREGSKAILHVVDRGPGPGADAEDLFQPYVTTRADGTGLGLPIARALAEANGGFLTLASRKRGGCVAILELPAAEDGA